MKHLKRTIFRLWNGTRVAHRANIGNKLGNNKYPENSISAATYATKNGVDAIELDVQLSKNKELIVFQIV
jgi:glycerophosphoryl diester phosphodiesterase